MDVHKAWCATYTAMLVTDNGRTLEPATPGDANAPACSWVHLEDMDRWMRHMAVQVMVLAGDGTPAAPFTREEFKTIMKMHRWLGWLQGVAVAYGMLTLDEVKDINKRA